MSDQPKRESYVGQAWLVRIDENRKKETYDVIPLLVDGADKANCVELTVKGKSGEEVRVYKAVAAGGTHKGWVLPAGGQGFNDRIELLIGLDAGLSTITGLYVLDQKETPGLGAYITGEGFRGQFSGKPTDAPLVVVKSDAKATNEIRAITGATISSESVTGIVNAAIADLKEPILRQATPGTGTSNPAQSVPEDNLQQGTAQKQLYN